MSLSSETDKDREDLGQAHQECLLSEIEGHREEHHVVLSYSLPVLVSVDLLPLLDVPEENYDGCYDCDDGTHPLVVPLHVMEEEADTLAGTWPIVVAIKELLSQLIEEMDFASLSVVKRPYFIVHAWVILE